MDVGCAFKTPSPLDPDPENVDTIPVGCNPVLEGGFAPVIAGDVGAEPGIGGNDSINDAPKDEDGLNGFKPEKPVI